MRLSLRNAALAAIILTAVALPGTAKAEILFSTTGTSLVRFDSASPGAVTTIGSLGLGANESVLDIDFRPATGVLYGLTSASRLVTIDTTTGSASFVGSAASFTLASQISGIDFNPTVDRIRLVGSTGQNLRLNPDTGALAATDTSLAYAAGDPNFGLAPGVSQAAYTNNFSGATTTTLYDLDLSRSLLATQTPPNNGTLNTVGSLGITLGGTNAGFDISGMTGVAFALLTPSNSTTSSLYTINLATGAATLLGNTGLVLRGLSVVPEPTSLALLGLGVAGVLAVARRRRRVVA